MNRRVSSAFTRVLVSSFLIFLLSPAVTAQVNVQGNWITMSSPMPINPIHVALLSNGKVLVVAGSGNCPPAQSGCPSGAPYGPSNSSGALLLDPVSSQIVAQFSVSWDMFCNGMVLLQDGRALIDGGTIQYDPFHGQPLASIFDPSTNTFSSTQNMAHGRWYPTVLTLGDGRIMTFSGLDENGNTNTAVEFYTPGSGWSTQYFASWTPDLYPRLHLLPNGQVFYSGAQTTSKLFNPSTTTWNVNFARTNYSGRRTYGTSVLLPLTPTNNYDPKVIIMGGGNPATSTTELIDLASSTPQWQSGPNMSQARIEMNAVILPNGKVLALGGSLNDEDTTTASLNADLYDPAMNSFSSAGANGYPRLYHSVALLLPDATIWVAGGNPSRGSYVQQMEIYQPAYLFNPDGTMATRPSITTAPPSISYGNTFSLTTPDAANISSVVLVRNGTVTHAFAMDQREVGLSFTPGSGALTITAPPNGNIAPAGYYMLFILNNSGVPSIASFVQVGPPQPDFSIAATPSSQSVLQGSRTSYSVTVTSFGGFNGSVTLSASGLPTGATASFNPASVNGSGSSTMTVTTSSTTSVGSYTLTVTGSSGSLSHPTTVTLVVNSATVPTVTGVTPNSGLTAGGTGVTITGTNFANGATVTFGGTPATNVVVASATQITATTPAHAAGAVTVTVTNPDTRSGSLANGFMYNTGLISFAQVATATPQTPTQVVSVTFPGPQNAGDLNIVVVGWNDTTTTVQSVQDSAGNRYTRAIGPTSGAQLQQSIYYAASIVGGNNTVTVQFNQPAVYPDIRILEYQGAGALDVTAGAASSSNTANSGSATTNSANELIFGAGTTANGFSGSGSGFTTRIITNDGDIAEDKPVGSTGSYSATGPIGTSAAWVMQMATFFGNGQSPAPIVASIAPTSGPTAGGTGVTITGTYFVNGATVTFGGTAATGVTVVSATQITATTPAHAAGAVTVTVTNPDTHSGSLANAFTFTTLVPISFAQVAASTPQTPTQIVPVTFPGPQNAGDLNVVVVGWNDLVATVQSVNDSAGNTYTLAIGPTSGNQLQQSIYYAANIVGGNNTVTVTFDQAAVYPDIRIVEYTGVSTLDATAGASGSAANASSGSATTKSSNELIVGAGTTAGGFTGAGSGFTTNIITRDGDIEEDQIVMATGSYSATAPVISDWVMQMVTFK